MKKYILKSTGKEVKIGDVVDFSFVVKTVFGEEKVVQKVKVTEDTVNHLISAGLIKEATELIKNEIKPLFRKIARNLDLSLPEAELFVAVIHDVSPYAAYQLLLEQALKKINTGKDLSKYKWFYFVNPNMDIRTCQNGGNYNVPVFISEEDAQKALNLVEDYFKSVYGEQEDNKCNSN